MRACPAGWTQAINSLGMCANPTEEQLVAERPTVQRATRAIQKKFGGPKNNQQVVKVIYPHTLTPHTHMHSRTYTHVHNTQVMVFKGADNKAAVIRAATYDLLFNNMKSLVVRTASTYINTRTHNLYDNLISVCVCVCGGRGWVRVD